MKKNKSILALCVVLLLIVSGFFVVPMALGGGGPGSICGDQCLHECCPAICGGCIDADFTCRGGMDCHCHDNPYLGSNCGDGCSFDCCPVECACVMHDDDYFTCRGPGVECLCR